MFRFIMMLPICFLIVSCAEVHDLDSNGIHRRYEVTCSGKAVSMDVCYEKAKSLCPNGYTIFDNKVGKRNPYPANSSIGIATALSNEIPGVVKGINIECK